MNLKESLRSRTLTIGSWVMLGNVSVIEIMKHADFQWLVVDLEHTDIDLKNARILISTIQASGMQALVRVSKNEEVIIKRILDMGADGIIVPNVCSREDAIQAVNYSKYPPQGTRGVGLFRAQEYGLGFNEYLEKTKNQQVIIAQIEHINAVNSIEEILTVKDIDGFIIGPYDMSASMGMPGMYHKQEVKDAVSKVLNACKKAGKSVGFHVVETEPQQVKDKIEEGCNLIAYSIDYIYLRDMAINKMKELKEMI